tara:strand:+ start:2601 stop:2849 length:249 start_codon:yes stop_codon:yes gene_type:complete
MSEHTCDEGILQIHARDQLTKAVSHEDSDNVPESADILPGLAQWIDTKTVQYVLPFLNEAYAFVLDDLHVNVKGAMFIGAFW